MGAQKFQRRREGCGSKRTEPTDIAGTPWASKVSGLTLGDEMQQFKEFMVPCTEERKQRMLVRTAVQDKVTCVFQEATVKLCDDFGMNMAPFTRGMSLVVDGVEDADAVIDEVEKLADNVADITRGSDQMSIVVQGIATEIYFTQDTKSQRRTLTSYLKRELQQHPYAELTAFVLSTILESCKIISKTFTTTAFLVLVLGYSKMVGNKHKDAGDFLKGFMQHIGTSFKPENTMVDLRSETGFVDVPPHMASMPFIILDPVSGLNLVNMVHPMFFVRLKLTMQNCNSHMEVTEADLAGRVPTSVGPRSVLSTVIAYHEYWPRAFKFQREAKARSPAASYSMSPSVSPSVTSSDDDCH